MNFFRNPFATAAPPPPPPAPPATPPIPAAQVGPVVPPPPAADLGFVGPPPPPAYPLNPAPTSPAPPNWYSKPVSEPIAPSCQAAWDGVVDLAPMTDAKESAALARALAQSAADLNASFENGGSLMQAGGFVVDGPNQMGPNVMLQDALRLDPRVAVAAFAGIDDALPRGLQNR